WMIPSLVIVTFLVYVAIRIGTNPAESYKRSNPRATPKVIEDYKKLNNLTGNYVVGYLKWSKSFLAGLFDGGESWQRTIKGRQSVWPLLKNALANTIRLGL